MTCIKCGTELNCGNWLPSRQRRNHHICAQCVRNDNTQRYQARKSNYLPAAKLVRATIKREVFIYYGGECQICGETDFTKLSLDHMDGLGRQHRKEVLGTDSGSQFYKWVLKNKPNNLRLLCFNCNCQVDMDKKELLPTYSKHQYSVVVKRNKYIDLKMEVFSHYSSKCADCGENRSEYLTMDHVNDDGASHRREIGTQIFPWLKRNNYPDDFQILCFNCNYAKSRK